MKVTTISSRRTKIEDPATLLRFEGGPLKAACTGEGGALGILPPGLD